MILHGQLIPVVRDNDSWDLTEIQWILIIEKEAKGYPDVASRQFLRQLGTNAHHIPMFVLVDLDPDGIAILSTYKYGSYRLMHEDVALMNTSALCLPNVQWLGVKSDNMSPSLVGEDGTERKMIHQLQGLMRLTTRDRIKATRMLEWDLCAEDGFERGWRRELQWMLMLNVKAEMQVLDELPGGLVSWLSDQLGDAKDLLVTATKIGSDCSEDGHVQQLGRHAKRAYNALTCSLETEPTMSGSAALPNDPRISFQAPSLSQGSASHSSCEQHGSATTESNATPQPLTSTTTTKQSVPLGVFSTLLGNNSTSTLSAQPILSDEAVPAILIHAQPPDTQEGPSDLTASLSSVPSATTTLTNTLPPTQSAALRALNAPAFHSSPSKSKSAKSTSSRTTVTSQPVVVRTYSGSRHTSRAGSGFNTPRSFAMNGNNHTSALSAGLAGRSEQLPSADDFSFSAILRAVDPEIRDAIDAIAEICARSRMSLADEYDSHLPPQGEITGTGPGWAASTGALVGRGRLNRISQGWTAADNTLMAVPEASSSSERLAQEGKAESNKKRSQSAYGSLKSVISGGSGKRKAIDGDTFREQEASSSKQDEVQNRGPPWAVHTSTSSSHPAITLAAPTASKHLSLDTSSTMQDKIGFLVHTSDIRAQNEALQRPSSRQRRQTIRSLPSPRARAGTLGSLKAWLPWPRPSDLNHDAQQELARAEDRLRRMLMSPQNLGKGKATVSVV
ncbi:hypothetical protein COCHEDRAFT_1193911 [Bipolaris maydis C5]|uniref:Topoisomerase 6 subunit A/Spo11 TOPRIM domain-containing protein n=1 Tax=Cochliobolus heterostrophus (strain C5 / ATCC 48332 / race O) TaxID=701091 RepID=M2UFF2_COCH5|nr:hypothetical protein COCHEDRAFT_1193911 [Bipolaris maydis C5]KAJ5022255.1 hypothetical protein J3E73DRAFT_434384 [Bipolaris maydis]